MEPPVTTDETVTMALTGKGQIMGTLLYMSPEQLQGRDADARSDIFSFGLVLYEMLTGTRPFAGGPLQAVMHRVLSESPLPLDVCAPSLPARLNEIVMRALAKDPEKRYQTALAMANDSSCASEPPAL